VISKSKQVNKVKLSKSIGYGNPRHHHYNHAPINLGDNLVLPHISNTYKYKQYVLPDHAYMSSVDQSKGQEIH
jgi:hypothetical protein